MSDGICSMISQTIKTPIRLCAALCGGERVNPFPLKTPQSARMLKMSSAKTFVLIYALFVRILYEICITDYTESYILGQQLSLACSGRLAPRARQGKLLTQSRPDQ